MAQQNQPRQGTMDKDATRDAGRSGQSKDFVRDTDSQTDRSRQSDSAKKADLDKKISGNR